MDQEPFVSAVVEVSPEAPGPEDEPPGDGHGSVAMQAAAMLGGADMGVAEPGLPPPGPSGDETTGIIAKTKGYFTRAGFEVHAPVGTSFSIAAHQSAFEEFFGKGLAVDDETLGRPVTTADGGQDLPLDPLPPEIRNVVKRIYFIPPPELPPF